MKSKEEWVSELVSDERWFELLRHYKSETIAKAAEKVYAGLVADGTVDVRPMQENRKHVYNILIKAGPGDKVLPKWNPKVVEPEPKEPVVIIPENEIKRRLQEWQNAISQFDDKKIRPLFDDEADENGQVDPPKPKAKFYPSTPLEDILKKEAHIAYIQANYDPRTGDKLPGWMDEETYNKIICQNK